MPSSFLNAVRSSVTYSFKNNLDITCVFKCIGLLYKSVYATHTTLLNIDLLLPFLIMISMISSEFSLFL